jgi:hypothetical protein
MPGMCYIHSSRDCWRWTKRLRNSRLYSISASARSGRKAVRPVLSGYYRDRSATGRSTVVEFNGSHFERENILWGVRWYVAYPISYRQRTRLLIYRLVRSRPSGSTTRRATPWLPRPLPLQPLCWKQVHRPLRHLSTIRSSFICHSSSVMRSRSHGFNLNWRMTSKRSWSRKSTTKLAFQLWRVGSKALGTRTRSFLLSRRYLPSHAQVKRRMTPSIFGQSPVYQTNFTNVPLCPSPDRAKLLVA